jgi:hypothetical protein
MGSDDECCRFASAVAKLAKNQFLESEINFIRDAITNPAGFDAPYQRSICQITPPAEPD